MATVAGMKHAALALLLSACSISTTTDACPAEPPTGRFLAQHVAVVDGCGRGSFEALTELPAGWWDGEDAAGGCTETRAFDPAACAVSIETACPGLRSDVIVAILSPDRLTGAERHETAGCTEVYETEYTRAVP